MTKHISVENKRLNRAYDAYVLFLRHKIDLPEYQRLMDMIKSEDEENLVLAAAIIKEKFRNPKKLKK